MINHCKIIARKRVCRTRQTLLFFVQFATGTLVINMTSWAPAHDVVVSIDTETAHPKPGYVQGCIAGGFKLLSAELLLHAATEIRVCFVPMRKIGKMRRKLALLS